MASLLHLGIPEHNCHYRISQNFWTKGEEHQGGIQSAVFYSLSHGHKGLHLRSGVPFVRCRFALPLPPATEPGIGDWLRAGFRLPASKRSLFAAMLD